MEIKMSLSLFTFQIRQSLRQYHVQRHHIIVAVEVIWCVDAMAAGQLMHLELCHPHLPLNLIPLR